MAMVPGLVAVLRIISPGNKVALGETVSLVEETLEENLRGEHPARPVRPGGCSSHP